MKSGYSLHVAEESVNCHGNRGRDISWQAAIGHGARTLVRRKAAIVAGVRFSTPRRNSVAADKSPRAGDRKECALPATKRLFKRYL